VQSKLGNLVVKFKKYFLVDGFESWTFAEHGITPWGLVKSNSKTFCQHLEKEFLGGGFGCNLLIVGEICAHGITQKLNQTFPLVEFFFTSGWIPTFDPCITSYVPITWSQ
jgi:hypothetical protein